MILNRHPTYEGLDEVQKKKKKITGKNSSD